MRVVVAHAPFDDLTQGAPLLAMVAPFIHAMPPMHAYIIYCVIEKSVLDVQIEVRRKRPYPPRANMPRKTQGFVLEPSV